MMPDSIQIRPYQPADLLALVDLINRAVAHDQQDGHVTPDELRDHFERPYFNPQANCLVAVGGAGRMAGYVTAELDPRVGRGWGSGHVDPDARRRGIGRRLIQAADDRHRVRAQTEVPPGLRLTVTRYCRDTNIGARALLESEGYAVVMESWFMAINLADLPEPGAAPLLPEGYTLRPFDRERDAHTVYAFEQALFRDNPHYVEPPFDVWAHIKFGPTHDPALWLVAVDAAGAIAGLCLGQRKDEGIPEVGWIDTLGVRATDRKRGLGRALLRSGFAAFRQRGYSVVELEVDSSNEWRAATLYERAGMHVKRSYLIYETVLREGAP